MIPSSLGPLSFALPLGLFALLVLVPFIILHLIRPRPKKLELPSLMFFIRRQGRNVVFSIFTALIRDALFLVSAGIILSLLLVPSQPSHIRTVDVAAANTAIVLDTSASSQAMEGKTSRFETAVSQASRSLGSKNAIILADARPRVFAKELSASEAERMLRTIKPSDTATRLGDAMLLAGEALAGSGRVVVVSDLDSTAGTDIKTAAAALASRGIAVSFVTTAKNKLSNIGFVDLIPDEIASTAYIRNFGDEQKTVKLAYGSTTKDIVLAPNGLEPIKIPTTPGITELKLETGDAFAVDDVLRIVSPNAEKLRVLLITNSKSRYLESALTASPRIALEVSEPPIISKNDYDVYVIDSVNPKEVLPGSFDDILQRVKKGAGAVIVAQDDIASIPYNGLLPVTVEDIKDSGTARIDHETELISNIEFSDVRRYPFAKPREGALTLVSAQDDSALFVLKQENAGEIAYLGLNDASTWHLTPDYPIFWQRLLRHLAAWSDMESSNRKAGTTVQGEAIAPDKTKSDGILTLDKAGIWQLNGLSVAVNLLDSKESSLALVNVPGAVEDAGMLEKATEEQPLVWEPLLLWIAAILLVAELIILKLRGDI